MEPTGLDLGNHFSQNGSAALKRLKYSIRLTASVLVSQLDRCRRNDSDMLEICCLWTLGWQVKA